LPVTQGVPGTLYAKYALVDTSAVVPLLNTEEQFHKDAKQFFSTAGLKWFALNSTSHEAFTHIRYASSFKDALGAYEFLRAGQIQSLEFTAEDELEAKKLLTKYRDQKLSYHDALCAVVMLRKGIYQIFTFDSDFWIFGFQVLPGVTRSRI
jgi:predicted nucleic acid-binding protein